MPPGRRRGIVPCMTLDPDAAVKHLDRLYAAALALARDPWLAEDLVQDVYLTTLTGRRKLTGGSELGYLLRALYNRYSDHWREAKRRPAERPVEDEHGLASPSAGPELLAEHAEAVAAVRRLERPYRETVVAVDMLGLSYSEAAQALDRPIGTIMSRLSRAREQVAAEFRDLTPAAQT
jgi:RNA polymerase sigma-70 factor, ECF subfamily